MCPEFKKHFRIYFKSNHPAYIVGEKGQYFIFHRVTSCPKSGHHNNWKIFPNPNKRKSTPMYIVKTKQHDKKNRFSKKLKYNITLNFYKIKSD